MSHLESGAVVELLDLLRHRLGDLRVGMAERAAPQPREAVEQALALGGGVVGALGARENPRAWIPLQVAVGRERHPVRAGAQALAFGKGGGLVLHGKLLGTARDGFIY